MIEGARYNPIINATAGLCLLFLINTYNLYSQFTGYGNDQRYQAAIGVPDLKIIPPIDNEMPASTQNGYYFVDNLSQVNTCSYLRDYLRYSVPDTVKYYASYLYDVIDYSPILFSRYLSTADKLTDNNKYKSSPECLFTSTQSAIQQNYGTSFGKDYAFLCLSQYILRVTIDSVIVGDDTTGTMKMRWVNVSCRVLEQIKGKQLPCNCKLGGSTKPGYYQIIPNNPYCLNFGYIENWETGTGFQVGDLAKGRMGVLTKGKEYLVFLKHVSNNANEDIITPELRFESTGGLFPIENGNLIDESNFWGQGIINDVALFRDFLRKKIDTIRSWNGEKYNAIYENLISGLNRINVLPHPVTTDEYQIKLNIINPAVVRIVLQDLQGRIIRQEAEMLALPGENTINADATNLIAGFYILSVYIDNYKLSYPLVILK